MSLCNSWQTRSGATTRAGHVGSRNTSLNQHQHNLSSAIEGGKGRPAYAQDTGAPRPGQTTAAAVAFAATAVVPQPAGLPEKRLIPAAVGIPPGSTEEALPSNLLGAGIIDPNSAQNSGWLQSAACRLPQSARLSTQGKAMNSTISSLPSSFLLLQLNLHLLSGDRFNRALMITNMQTASYRTTSLLTSAFCCPGDPGVLVPLAQAQSSTSHWLNAVEAAGPETPLSDPEFTGTIFIPNNAVRQRHCPPST